MSACVCVLESRSCQSVPLSVKAVQPQVPDASKKVTRNDKGTQMLTTALVLGCWFFVLLFFFFFEVIHLYQNRTEN